MARVSWMIRGSDAKSLGAIADKFWRMSIAG
jgi:hypothetical protein